jgi:hypothetical protein
MDHVRRPRPPASPTTVVVLVALALAVSAGIALVRALSGVPQPVPGPVAEMRDLSGPAPGPAPGSVDDCTTAAWSGRERCK